MHKVSDLVTSAMLFVGKPDAYMIVAERKHSGRQLDVFAVDIPRCVLYDVAHCDGCHHLEAFGRAETQSPKQLNNSAILRMKLIHLDLAFEMMTAEFCILQIIETKDVHRILLVNSCGTLHKGVPWRNRAR